MRLIRRFSLVASAVALCTTAGNALAQNDLCANAIALTIGTGQAGTTVGQTIDTGAPVCSIQTVSAPGVWYTVVGNGNTLTAGLCSGASYDSRITVYCTSGAPCTNLAAFACVAANDDSCGALSSTSFCSAAGQTYYILVHGFSTATGAHTVLVTSGAACATAVSCAPPITGACCSTAGACTVVINTSCTGTSIFQGANTVCDPSPCLNVGSCCVTASGACTIRNASGCVAAGTVFTLGNVTCTPNPCPQPVTGACCSVLGVCTTTAIAACTGTSVFQGANTLCSPNPCPPAGSCCTNCCVVTLQASCTGTWTSGGICTPNPCPAPLNDLCTGAIPVTAGVPVTGDNCNATSSNDGPAASCQASSGKGVWYSFASPGGNFGLSTCGSNQDTVITVFTTPDCVTFTQVALGCDDDACDGITPPGSGLASNIATLSLPAGNYLVRISTFGGAPVGGPFTLAINAVVSGACCSATGVCTTTLSTACTGTFQGANSVCDPSPCPNVGSCCVTASGACSITASSGCTAVGSVFTLGNVTCTPNPCPQPVSGACCNVGCCTFGAQTACVSPGVFQGANSTCTPGLCGVGEPNDECVGLGPTFTFAGTGFTTTGSNLLACTTGPSACGAGGAFDVFYAFTPSIAGPFTANLCGSSSNWDSVLSIHTACPPSAANQVVGFCNDDNCTAQIGTSAIITPVALTAGQTYFVRVAGFINTNFGPNRATFVLSVDSGALGACCQTNGACLIGTQNLCTGTWTASITCSPTPCPQPSGSCCATNGNCTVVLGAVACTGTFTIGGICTPNTCTQPSGSCCATDGSCSVVLGAGACTGTFAIAGVCTPNICPQPLPNDTCATAAVVTVGTPAATGDNANALTSLDEDVSCTTSSKGVWYDFTATAAGLYTFDTENSTQADTVLEVFTACGGTSLDCDDDGGTGALSLAQVTMTAGQNVRVLVASFGSTPTGGGFNLNISVVLSGACCDGTTCTETLANNCAFVFTAGNVCSPNSCAPATGACCCGASCTVTTSAACPTGPGTNATYSAGGVCTPFSLTVPCCRSDYNKSGGVPSVQDIFDFLSGYFAASPCADTNDVGGVSVQDIFDFLSAYFGGC